MHCAGDEAMSGTSERSTAASCSPEGNGATDHQSQWEAGVSTGSTLPGESSTVSAGPAPDADLFLQLHGAKVSPAAESG